MGLGARERVSEWLLKNDDVVAVDQGLPDCELVKYFRNIQMPGEYRFAVVSIRKPEAWNLRVSITTRWSMGNSEMSFLLYLRTLDRISESDMDVNKGASVKHMAIREKKGAIPRITLDMARVGIGLKELLI